MNVQHNVIPWYRSRPFFLSVFSILALLHLFIPVFNHYLFRTVAFDFAAYNFAFFDYAHLRISPCPVYLAPYPVSFFQDHFSFLLPVLSPLFWVIGPFAGTYTLVILQWLLIISGAWFTHKIIFLRSGDLLLSTLSVVFYFVLFGRFSSYRADVNLAIMGSAMVPAFLYFFEKKNFTFSTVVYVLLLLTREDFALWMFFVCLFCLIIYRKEKKQMRIALSCTLTAVIYFIICFQVLIPAFLEDEFKKYSLFDYKSLGSGPMEALIHIVNHPVDTFRILYRNHLPDEYYNSVKIDFYTLFLFSGGIILLLKPWYFIPFIPLIAKKMFNDSPIRWSGETYYSVEIVTILPLMAFLVILDLKRTTIRNGVATIVCCVAIMITVYRISYQPALPLLSEDNKYNFLTPAFYKTEREVKNTNLCISQIPANAPVTASSRIAPHLAFREKIYLFPRVEDAQYILVYKKEDTYPLSPEQFAIELENHIRTQNWTVLHNSDDLLFLKRRTPGS